jgi:hypothetical protein
MDEAEAEDVTLLLTRSLRASMAEACSLLEACGHPCRAAPYSKLAGRHSKLSGWGAGAVPASRCGRRGGVRAGGHWQLKREREESDAPFVRCGFRAIDNG